MVSVRALDSGVGLREAPEAGGRARTDHDAVAGTRARQNRDLARLLGEALRRVRDAGGRIELARLGHQLRLDRTELDRLLAYADDERRGLLRVDLDVRTGANTVALTRAGARTVRSTTAARSRGA